MVYSPPSMDQPKQQLPIKHLSPFITPVHPRHGSIKIGRIPLIFLFFALGFIDAIQLLRIYPIMNDKDTFLGALIAMAIFTTVLLICVWFHQNWARYMLTGTLLLIGIIGLSLIPCLRDLPNLSGATIDILGLLAGYLCVAVVLIISKDIRRLTSRRFE